MKKKVKKEESVKPVKVETTGTDGEATGTAFVAKVKINKLSVGFPNEDMNQVVAKLNEVIDKLND